MKKIIVCFLCIFALLGVNCLAFSFEDVDKADEKAEYIYRAYKLGLFEGDSEGCFNPEKIISRAEFAVLSCRVKGVAKRAKNKSTDKFSDLPKEHWANCYVAAAVSYGIIDGYDDGTFRPGDGVTDIQAIKMLICAKGLKERAEKLGGYPEGYTKLAEEFGIETPLSAQPLCRANAAEYVCKIYEKKTVKAEKAKQTDEKDGELEEEEETEKITPGEGLVLKQEESDTCTACAFTMLMRRAFYLDEKDYSEITEENIKNDENVWLDGVGLYHIIEYEDYKVVKKVFEEEDSRESLLKKMMKTHPEGIIIYDSDKRHALLLTEVTDGVYYVCDPANGERLPIEETVTTEGETAEEKLEQIDSVWLIEK